jgi:hypothetical protein
VNLSGFCPPGPARSYSPPQAGRYARRSVRAPAPHACITHGRVAAGRYARYTQRCTVHARQTL